MVNMIESVYFRIITFVLVTVLIEINNCTGKPLLDSGFTCVCPTVRRSICGYTSTGIIMKFDNLCSLKCHALNNKDFRFGILTPNLCEKGLHPYLEEKGDEVYLKEWTEYIKEEINFWKPLELILGTLLNEV